MKLSFTVELTVPYRTDKETVCEWVRQQLQHEWWKLEQIRDAWTLASEGEMRAVERGEL